MKIKHSQMIYYKYSVCTQTKTHILSTKETDEKKKLASPRHYETPLTLYFNS